MGTARTVNRLHRASHEQLVDYITRALAQGRLRGLSDQEIANVATHALGFVVTKGNIKGVRVELELRKNKGSKTITVEGVVPLTACDRPIRVSAMHWLQFLDEAELLEESIVDTWGKVTYHPDARRLSLMLSHGPLSTKIKDL